MLAPTPDLPDDTPLSGLLLATRLVNVFREADFTTVGKVRNSSDRTLLSLRDMAAHQKEHGAVHWISARACGRSSEL